MKSNCCEIEFSCHEPVRKACVYFSKTDEHDDCKYMELSYCNSKIAQVNRMTIQLKEELNEKV